MLIDRRDIAELQPGPETDVLVAAIIGELCRFSHWPWPVIRSTGRAEEGITVHVYTVYAWRALFNFDRGALV